MMILYFIIGIIALILGRAVTISSTMKISKEIVINRPPSEVFDFIVILQNHKQFNKWTMTDPDVQIDYRGTDGTEGFSSHWKSKIKNVGEGIQRIASVLNKQEIVYDLTFIQPFAGTATARIITEPRGDNATSVTWEFAGPRNFQSKIMQALLNLEKMLGKDLEISLRNLKRLLEK